MEDFSFVIINGEKFFLACKEPPIEGFASPFMDWTDTEEVIPRSKWAEVDYSHLDDRVLNQGRTNGCVGWSAATAGRLATAMYYGKPADLSPSFIYAQINDGVDRGSYLYRSLEALKTIGACLESQNPNDRIFKKQVDAACYETAKLYRISGRRCRNFDQLASAIQRGFIVSFGIPIGNGLGYLDSEGISRITPPIGGHAMTGVGLKKTSKGWCIKQKNSWGKAFGMNGYSYLTEGFFEGSDDGWSLQYMTTDFAGPGIPPVAVA